MTVKELREVLSRYPDDLIVLYEYDGEFCDFEGVSIIKVKPVEEKWFDYTKSKDGSEALLLANIYPEE